MLPLKHDSSEAQQVCNLQALEQASFPQRGTCQPAPDKDAQVRPPILSRCKVKRSFLARGAENSKMTTLLDKHRSATSKVHGPGEAALDQVLSRAPPRSRRGSPGSLPTLSKIGDCPLSSCPLSSRRGSPRREPSDQTWRVGWRTC